MPLFNSRGDYVAGVGTAPIQINTTLVDSGGGRGDWFTDDEIIYGREQRRKNRQAGSREVVIYHMHSGQTRQVFAGDANSIEGGGGVWAIWNNTGLHLSDGIYLPLAGVGTVGPDGAVAYSPDYQSSPVVDVRERDGSVWRLTDSVAYDIQLLGQRRATWTENHAVRVTGLPEPSPPITDAGRPRISWLYGEAWVCYWSHGLGRIVLRPLVDGSEGYILDPGDKFNHDFIALGQLAVVWAHGSGEHSNTVSWVDPTQPRVPLTPPEPPDPPIDPPPIHPPPLVIAPTATISSYEPDSGVEPLKVKAYGRQTSGDAVDQIEWLSRRQGSRDWDSVEDDWDHTYTFSAGAWEIALRVSNEGGFDQTGSQRLVYVDLAPEPPIPPEPEPEPPVGLPDYDTFVNHECPAVAEAYKSVNPDPSVPTPQQMGHTSWRRLEEAWTHRDIVHDILGEPLEDGGAGGANTGSGSTPPPTQPTTPSGDVEPLRKEGRILRTASGARFLWRSATSFRLLHMIATGQEPQAIERMQQLSAMGYNVVRVLATARHLFDLPADMGRGSMRRLFDLALANKLYVEIVALADTEDWPKGQLEAQLQEVYTKASEYPNVLVEGANEIGPVHETQSDEVVDVCKYFHAGGAALYCPGSVHGGGFCDDQDALTDEQWAHGQETGEWPYWDEVHTFAGHFGTSHLKRDGSDADRGRRVRELEASSNNANCLFVDDEPIGANEVAIDSKRYNEPGVAYLQGVLMRIFETGSCFHSEAGLRSDPFGPAQQTCAEAFINGSRIVADGVSLLYKNAGWHDAPIKEFTGACRIYSGLGADNIACVIAPEGNLSITYQNGWRDGGIRADVTGCRVISLVQG